MNALYNLELKELDSANFSGKEIVKWECLRCGNVYDFYLPYACECRHKNFKLQDFSEAISFYKNNPVVLSQEAIKMIKAGLKAELTEILAKTFQQTRKTYTTRFDERNEMYVYEEGIYIPEGRSKIKEQVRKTLQEQYTEQIANSVIAKIEADTYIEQEKFLKRHYSELVAVKNGVLNVKTKELTPYTPEKIFFNKINASYIPESDCPNIQRFLEEVLPDKTDVETIFAWFGYCLLGGYPIQKILLLIGEGANGKGRVCQILREFLGKNSYVGIEPQKLEINDFKECELFGKLANIGSDISDVPLKTSSKIKGLTGGDAMTVSRKFKQDLTFENEAKMLFSANKLPKTYDFSIGFFRRWIYMNFPNKFLPKVEYDSLPEEKRTGVKIANAEIVKELLTEKELDGLLCKSLHGLDNLLKTGGFPSSKTHEETMKWWIRNSDSFLAFCWEELEDNPNESVSKEELRREYKKYCRQKKLAAEGEKHIYEIMTREMMAIDSQNGVTGERIWEGITLKSKLKVVQL